MDRGTRSTPTPTSLLRYTTSKASSETKFAVEDITKNSQYVREVTLEEDNEGVQERCHQQIEDEQMTS